MKDLDYIFRNQQITLTEWAHLLQDLSEKSKGPDSGAEVSRGKDPMDQSQAAAAMGPGAPNGGGPMAPGGMDPSMGGGMGGDPMAGAPGMDPMGGGGMDLGGLDPAMMDPALDGAGGSTGDPIAIGKKDVDSDGRVAISEPKIELGGGQDGIDLKPVIKPEYDMGSGLGGDEDDSEGAEMSGDSDAEGIDTEQELEPDAEGDEGDHPTEKDKMKKKKPMGEETELQRAAVALMAEYLSRQ